MGNRNERARVRRVQRALNRFTRRQRLGYPPLKVDGWAGAATRARIRNCKHLVGYGRSRIDGKAGEWFVFALAHPNRVDRHQGRPPEAIRRGRRRRVQRRRQLVANRVRAYLKPGVTTWGGKPVAKVAVPYLDYARAHGWRGYVTSGWRDPSYSRSLCIRMCGAPSCPGRCAGLASNHVGNTVQRFSIDVSDYVVFGRIMHSMPLPPGLPRIFNALGSRDPVHFSPSGR